VRVAGEVTLGDAESFFVQDATGGIRVQTLGNPGVKIGQVVEAIGFPAQSGEARVLMHAHTRAAREIRGIQPAKLDLTEMPVRQNGSLVRVEAAFLAQRTIGNSQILELQERQRIFTATLATDQGTLMPMTPGSRIGITGVCDSKSSALPPKTTAIEEALLGSINIWLRSPADVEIISGPPWWTWRRAAGLIGTLVAVSSGALLWVHLLRRRLDRQRAAQLAASQQILKRLEEERRRIAANLHDGLGQVLLAIKNQTLLAMQRVPYDATIRERLDEISGITSQALEEVSQITHGLRPYQLDRLGLTQAMRATVSRASTNSPILFASRVEDIDTVFDKDSEIHVYRIVQESINNIIKHSAATEAAVVIKNRQAGVSISVRDNGRGFDVGAMRTSQPADLGYGLSGIAERVRILGGHLNIDSRTGEGASLTIEIPVCNHDPGNNHTDRG
jgi:signal transduction histidine kinase